MNVQRWDVHFDDQSVVTLVKLAQQDGYVWIRIPHDVERVNVDDNLGGGRRYRGNLPEYAGDLRGGPVRGVVIDVGKPLPEVYPIAPEHSTEAACAVQWVWRKLNPDLNDNRWTSLGGAGLMVMNDTGFPGRYNCVTGEDKDQKFPRFHRPILQGGAVCLARVDGNNVWIMSILVGEPIPYAEEVLARRELWYWAVSVNPRGEVNFITRPSGEDSNGPNVPVRIPFVTTQAVWLPKDEVHILPEGFIPPSALWMPE